MNKFETDTYTFVEFGTDLFSTHGANEILDWFRSSGIPEEDWDFDSNPTHLLGIVTFKHREDAIAFKLRFNVV